MARRPDGDGGFNLSPRRRWIGGWIAAALLIAGIALAFRLLGGNGDGTVVDPSPSASRASGRTVITFGTALDPSTGEVAADARTERFTESDTFAYSIPPAKTESDAVYVEVRPIAGDTTESVQDPVDAQPLESPGVVAFSVRASVLFSAFGTGEFQMLIYADPATDPIAEGTFTLVAPVVSPAPSP